MRHVCGELADPCAAQLLRVLLNSHSPALYLRRSRLDQEIPGFWLAFAEHLLDYKCKFYTNVLLSL